MLRTMTSLTVESTLQGTRLTAPVSAEMQALFDATYKQGETFLVKGAGKIKAYIISPRVYESLRLEARRRFMDMTCELSQNFAHLTEAEKATLIEEAIQATRSENAAKAA
ncbi:MAG: hypothetical protein K8L91_15845 [Anaerolineae bacterium]|nr:hypothetical protein [Anaerolineae bacterium]